MPNWCTTNYTITGRKESISRLWDALNEAQKKAHIETDFGDMWLGHILSYLGMDDEQVCRGPVSCRGYITYANKEEDEIMLDTETAWGPMPVPLLMLCDKVAPDVRIRYYSVEPGMGFYATNDPSGGYHMEIWGERPPAMSKYDYADMNEQELRDLLIEVLGSNHRDESLDDLIVEITEKYEEMFINKWDIIGIEDL